jgi:predicted AlkP superfamily phosphohydrolase/phosphomutase
VLALLQFDSAALPLLEQMLADGRLPTLAALRTRGMWRRLDADATFLQSSTYMTLCTGVDVRDHGIYSAVPWSAADQRPRFMYSLKGPPTIWDRLTASRRRSLIVDPMLAWAPQRTNGVFLSGWQFEDRMVCRARSLPRNLRPALSRTYGHPPRLDDVYGTRRVAPLRRWRDALVSAPVRAADAVIDLLGRESFDLVWMNFGAAHKAGHHLWDPSLVVEPPIGEGDRRALQDGLTEVYRAVDTAIGRILEAVPGRADVIVFSPTGMAGNSSRADLLPAMLDAVLAGAAKATRVGTAGRGSPIWKLRSRIPVEWRDAVAGFLPDDLVGDLATRLYLRPDWSKTRAFAVPGENKGYVRVNLRGREREGIVDASEVDALLDEVADGLLTFRDPDGKPSISRVVRTADAAGGGTAVDRLPDLVVHWGPAPASALTRVSSPDYGDVVRHGVGSGRSGNHVDDAWALLLPGPSRVRDLGRLARITDIGATVCGRLGADATGLSGAPLLEAAG